VGRFWLDPGWTQASRADQQVPWTAAGMKRFCSLSGFSVRTSCTDFMRTGPFSWRWASGATGCQQLRRNGVSVGLPSGHFGTGRGTANEQRPFNNFRPRPSHEHPPGKTKPAIKAHLGCISRREEAFIQISSVQNTPTVTTMTTTTTSQTTQNNPNLHSSTKPCPPARPTTPDDTGPSTVPTPSTSLHAPSAPQSLQYTRQHQPASTAGCPRLRGRRETRVFC
jgi:hypothetical protein